MERLTLPANTGWQRVSNPISRSNEVTARVRCVRFGTSQDGQDLAFLRLADRDIGDILAITAGQFNSCDFWPSLDMVFVLHFTFAYSGGLIVLGVGEVESDAAH